MSRTALQDPLGCAEGGRLPLTGALIVDDSPNSEQMNGQSGPSRYLECPSAIDSIGCARVAHYGFWDTTLR